MAGSRSDDDPATLLSGLHTALHLLAAAVAGELFGGRAGPGFGDEAWLLEVEEKLMMRVGRTSAWLSVTGLPPSESATAMIRLAKIVAARMAVPPGR